VNRKKTINKTKCLPSTRPVLPVQEIHLLVVQPIEDIRRDKTFILEPIFREDL